MHSRDIIYLWLINYRAHGMFYDFNVSVSVINGGKHTDETTQEQSFESWKGKAKRAFPKRKCQEGKFNSIGDKNFPQLVYLRLCPFRCDGSARTKRVEFALWRHGNRRGDRMIVARARETSKSAPLAFDGSFGPRDTHAPLLFAAYYSASSRTNSKPTNYLIYYEFKARCNSRANPKAYVCFPCSDSKGQTATETNIIRKVSSKEKDGAWKEKRRKARKIAICESFVGAKDLRAHTEPRRLFAYASTRQHMRPPAATCTPVRAKHRRCSLLSYTRLVGPL